VSERSESILSHIGRSQKKLWWVFKEQQRFAFFTKKTDVVGMMAGFQVLLEKYMLSLLYVRLARVVLTVLAS
jgi:hypothetical protein